jgi:hypothetical protein
LWYQPIPASPAIDANSAAIVAFVAANTNFPQVMINSFGVAVAQTNGSDPLRTISCNAIACSNLVANNPVPIPLGTEADPGSDGHLAVWHNGTHREYDFWIYGGSASPSTTGSGGTCLTDGHDGGINPGHGAVATSMPMLATLLRPEELIAGLIQHSLAWVGNATAGVRTGFVFPAIGGDGNTSNADAPQEGSLFQLNPSYNVAASGLPSWEKTIATCLQTYGMYLVDKGGAAPAIYAENAINRGGTDPWSVFPLFQGNLYFSGSFPWSQMRVLQPRLSW